MMGLVALGALFAEKRGWFADSDPTNTAQPSSNKSDAGSQTQNDTEPDPATAWDGVDREMQEMLGESALFESRVRKLWDALPQPVVKNENVGTSSANPAATQETDQ
jgi:hypothetical protein